MPSNGKDLGAGIFFGMLSMRLTSIIARDFGWPDTYNTDWVTLPMLFAFIAGLLHIWAPEAIGRRIPRPRCTGTGMVVAIGVFIVFGLLTLRGHNTAPHPSIQLW